MSELKDWLNSINFNKEDLSYDIKDYPPYVINRCLSGFIDTIMYANEMNRYHNLDKDMQYSFYLNSVRKRKRFVKEYYGYSNEKASQALKILDNQQLNFIKQRLETGGTQ
jgi:hypothetical protein